MEERLAISEANLSLITQAISDQLPTAALTADKVRVLITVDKRGAPVAPRAEKGSRIFAPVEINLRGLMTLESSAFTLLSNEKTFRSRRWTLTKKQTLAEALEALSRNMEPLRPLAEEIRRRYDAKTEEDNRVEQFNLSCAALVQRRLEEHAGAQSLNVLISWQAEGPHLFSLSDEQPQFLKGSEAIMRVDIDALRQGFTCLKIVGQGDLRTKELLKMERTGIIQDALIRSRAVNRQPMLTSSPEDLPQIHFHRTQDLRVEAVPVAQLSESSPIYESGERICGVWGSTYGFEAGVQIGEPNADLFFCEIYCDHSVIGIADGCGHGEESVAAAQTARATFLKLHRDVLREHDLVGESQKAAQELRLALNTVNEALRLQEGSTTFLAGGLYELSQRRITEEVSHVFVFATIGDCKIYRISGDGAVVDGTRGMRPGLSPRDPGGRLGGQARNSLASARYGVLPCTAGDTLLLMTDGIHDNLDPEILGTHARRFLGHLQLFEERLSKAQPEISDSLRRDLIKEELLRLLLAEQRAKRPTQITRALQDHVVLVTTDYCQGGNPKGARGKPDHYSCIAVRPPPSTTHFQRSLPEERSPRRWLRANSEADRTEIFGLVGEKNLSPRFLTPSTESSAD